MNWFRRKTKTLYSKTLLGMFTISLIVLIIVAAILFVWFRAEMIGGYYDLTRATMGNTDVVFSSCMEDAKNMIMNWYASPDGVSLRLEEDTEFTNHMPFVNKTLEVLNSTTYLQSACFINNRKKMVVNLGSAVSFPENLDQILIDKMVEVDGRNRPVVWNVKSRRSNNEMISLLTIPMAETSINDVKFNGMAVMNIDLNQLNKKLFANRQEEQFRIYILNENGIIVGDSNLQYLGENWSEKAWVKRVLGHNEQFELVEDGERWEILSFPASEDGYFIAARSDYVTQIININYIFYIISAIIIAAAIVIIMSMLLVSRRIFQPFTRMVGNLKQSQMVETMEAETDEVTFLEHFYYGVASRIELLNEKKENDFIVKNLLLGNQRKEVQLLLKHKKMISDDGPYYMILVLVENRNLSENFSMQEYDMLRNMVSNIFSTTLEEHGRCTNFEVGLRRMLFMVSIEEGHVDDRMILEAIAKAENSICKLSQIRIFSMMSQSMRDGGDQCVSNFGKINDCMKTRHILGCEGTAILKDEDVVFSESIFNQMINCLKERDKNGYMEAVLKILTECEMMPYRQFVDRLELMAVTILKTGKICRHTEDKRLETKTLKEHITALTGKEEIMLWLESLYNEVAVQISKVSNHSTAVMMEEAVDYIRNNYEDCNLNVNLIADKLNISAAYFGKQFTEFTGAKTLDYILKVRMEKARDLLLSEPDKDIAQVAETVGYSNSTYFATAFRKYYGVTPSRFRDYHVCSKTNGMESV